MGTRAFIEFGRKLGLVEESDLKVRPVRLGIDVPLLLATVTLVIFGLLMVYSASWDFAYRMTGNPIYTLRRQINWIALGCAAAIFLAWYDYRKLRRWVFPGMIITVVLLGVVIILGQRSLGAPRSILSGSIQPSELAKFLIVLYLSVWLTSWREQLKEFGFSLFYMGIIVGVLGGLIALQPDLSAVITVFFLGILMFFLSGGNLRTMLVFVLVGILAALAVYFIPIFPTGQQRIQDFLEGLRDLLKSSDHVKRSIEAFVKGGWLGVGIGKSQGKLTGLPFPHTDSIFAVLGEETGVVGSVGLALLYLVILWRGVVISRNAPDGMGQLMATGLSFWIVIEAYLNMAVMVGLMPFAGNALPFISSGGSSMVVSLAAIGVLMSISRQSVQFQENKERSFHAVVDLRGRDRRRRVSRSVHSASTGRASTGRASTGANPVARRTE